MVNKGLKEGLMILTISRKTAKIATASRKMAKISTFSRKMAKISTVSRKMAKISTVSRESHHSMETLLNEKKHRLALLNSVDRP